MRPANAKPGRWCLATGWPIAAWYGTCPICGERVMEATHPIFPELQVALPTETAR